MTGKLEAAAALICMMLPGGALALPTPAGADLKLDRAIFEPLVPPSLILLTFQEPADGAQQGSRARDARDEQPRSAGKRIRHR